MNISMTLQYFGYPGYALRFAYFPRPLKRLAFQSFDLERF
jgi:hypothetical protein